MEAELSWIRPSGGITIHNHCLNRGNVYIGETFLIDKKYVSHYPSSDDKAVSASVINPMLPISELPAKKAAFHSYNDLSPYLRGQYLRWRSGEIESSALDDDIILLHLMGLRLRMFFDPDTTEPEREDILREVVDDRRIFLEEGRKGLASVYLDFIDAIVTRFFPDAAEKYLRMEDIKQLKLYRTIIIKNIVSKNIVLDSSTVYNLGKEWIYSHSPTPPEYEHLAEDIFRKAYRRPITVQMHEAPQIQSYSLTDSLHSMLFIPEKVDAYAQITATPFNRWEVEREIYWAYRNVYRAFSAYNKAIRENNGRITLQALFQMPKQVDIFAEEKVKDFVEFMQTSTSEVSMARIETNELLRRWEYRSGAQQLPKRLTDSMLAAFDKLGYGVEPDYRVHKNKLKAGDVCFVFAKRRKSPIKVDDDYLRMMAIVKMGLILAQSDDDARKDETDFIEEYIMAHITDLTKQKYLTAHLKYLAESKQKYLGLKNYAELFDCDETEDLYNFLIRLSLVDGEMNVREMEAVKKIMAYFDYECDDIHSVIHRIYTEGTETPFLVMKENAKRQFAIPAPNNYLPAFVMDNSRLDAIEKDTVASQRMLATIFSTDSREETPATLSASERTISILQSLMEKDIWKRSELEVICREFDLTVGAALEAVNDYSYEKIDDAVLDDDGEYVYVTTEYKEALL